MKFFKASLAALCLSVTACGADETPTEINAEVSVETKKSKAKPVKKSGADEAAAAFVDRLKEQLGHEALARHEVYAISATERYRPDQACFNVWFDTGDITATTELKNGCAVHVEKLQYIYESYGYFAKPEVFKSEWFWQYASDVDWKAVEALLGSSKLKKVECAIAKQQFYNDKRVQPLPDATPYGFCEG